ncbi:MAG: TIR domain-containing protein, partial [Lysobacterales bacterium]
PGSLYADEIVRAINGSVVLVLILSRHAMASPHVGKEIERAASKQHPILTLRIDAAPLSPAFEYYLSESHWIDLGPDGTDAAAAKLAVAIKRQTDPSAATEVSNRTDGSMVPRTPSTRSTRWIRGAGMAFVSLALVYFAVDRYWLPNRVADEQAAAPAQPAATTPISEKSIAVLPFSDMSEKKDQEYLADGMAEEILNLLAQVSELRVPARTSSFYFKDKPTKIREIALELGVAHILEGSIRRAGDQLRVTAQLIRADNGYHLWSETYDRDVKDLFKVQDDIANAVVQALQIKLMGGELNRKKGGTQNLEAYELFLRAESALFQNTRSSLDAAYEYADQAIRLDRNYGLAWMLRANAVLLQAENGLRDATEGYERARQELRHALQLSPEISDAHALLGGMLMTVDRNWAAAETEERKALAIDPNNSTALQGASLRSIALGRWDDAERQLVSELVRDPLNPYVLWALGTAYYGAGRLQESESVYRKLLETRPDFLWTRTYLGKTLLMQGKPEAALAMLQQEADESFRLMLLLSALLAAGRKAEADEAL